MILNDILKKNYGVLQGFAIVNHFDNNRKTAIYLYKTTLCSTLTTTLYSHLRDGNTLAQKS